MSTQRPRVPTVLSSALAYRGGPFLNRYTQCDLLGSLAQRRQHFPIKHVLSHVHPRTPFHPAGSKRAN